jgi:signal transduction histidine kinase
MTLRRKILVKMAALLGCFALLGVFSVWGFLSLRASNHAAQQEFHELREMRSLGVRLAVDKALLGEGKPRRAQLMEDLRAVLAGLNGFIQEQQAELDDDDSLAEKEHDAREREHAEKAIAIVQTIVAALQAADLAKADSPPGVAKQIDAALAELDLVADECSNFVSSVHASTRWSVLAALVAMAVLSATTLVAAILVGFSLHRSVVLPLQQLHEGVREMTAGHFTTRLPEHGDPEFLAVIREFNQMAGQLEEFYHRLEHQVAQKSRDLVRSERLASVGFLAAGVAHEIRNPLGIISGYAELSLKMLAGTDKSGAVRNSAREGRILGVIRDEAFRCKQITDKLLGLVQGGVEGRETVDLGRIVRDVAFLVRGLDLFRERRAELRIKVPGPLCVTANAIEVKQVVLNLTLNALDAVEPGSGQIDVEGQRANGRIELAVRDNGCGMTHETLERVFEPFFTGKRGRAAPGTGLGLSISHAIVEGYGGTLRAESDGPGRGSRFVIDLPAAQETHV